MNTNNTEHVIELLALFVLDELDSEASLLVKEHIKQCEHCRMHYEMLRDGLAQAVIQKPAEPDNPRWHAMSDNVYRTWKANKQINAYARIKSYLTSLSSTLFNKTALSLASIAIIIGLSILLFNPYDKRITAYELVMSQLKYLEFTGADSRPIQYNADVLGFNTSTTPNINSYMLGYSIANSTIKCAQKNLATCEPSLEGLANLLRDQKIFVDDRKIFDQLSHVQKQERSKIFSALIAIDKSIADQLPGKEIYLYSLGAWVRTIQVSIASNKIDYEHESENIGYFIRMADKYQLPIGVKNSLFEIKKLLDSKQRDLNSLSPYVQNIHALFV